jgi:hypothetical protein
MLHLEACSQNRILNIKYSLNLLIYMDVAGYLW